MKIEKLLSIVLLVTLIFQLISPLVYGVENVIEELDDSNINAQSEISSEVNFASEELKNYLIEGYNIDSNSDGKITTDEMQELTELSINLYIDGDNVLDLQGLEYATALKTLEVYTKSTNYEALTNLEKLENLHINHVLDIDNDYESITKISNLKQIEILYLDFKEANLYSLPATIEKLLLGGCVLEDINNIEYFSNLTQLSIISNYAEGTIQGLENIKKLTKLTDLTITYSNIEDISFLENNETIENLNLSYNKINNIDVIPTMSKLSSLDIAYNQIEDLSPIKNMEEIINNSWGFPQSYSISTQVQQNQKIELELPQTIKDCYDPTSIFYKEDISIMYNSVGDPNITISEDKTKLVIDATDLEIGKIYEKLTFQGAGLLSDTSIEVEYLVTTEADNVTEIEISSSTLKQYLLENHDIDNDTKITAYDMAQITALEIPWIEDNTQESLKGLEHAINLEKVVIPDCYTDMEVLEDLTKLKEININGWNISSKDCEVIFKLNNIEKMTLRNFDLNTYSLNNIQSDLTELNLDYCDINDISDIDRFTNLNQLTIWGLYQEKEIESLESINKLTQLSTLKLEVMGLKNIAFLKNNSVIENLYIGSNKLTDISEIKTLTNLKVLDIGYNQLEDLSILDELQDTVDIRVISQSLIKTAQVNLGENLEIELPKIIKDIFDSESKYYDESAKLVDNSDSESVGFTLNSEKTKITINTKDLKVGEYTQYISVNGNGRLSATTLTIDYKVMQPGDSTKEIEFGSQKIKDYILENHDIDEDGKITEFDMAQITYLSIPYIEDAKNEDLKGLEYCTSLENLEIYMSSTNYDAIKNLPNLKVVAIETRIENYEDYKAICSISNLTSLSLNYIEFDEFNIYELPSQLKELSLRYSNISNIEDIDYFSNLEKLCVDYIGGYEQLQGVSSVTKLSNLKHLSLQSVGLEDISFLNNNSTIEYLDLAYNNIKDVTPITTMTKLNYISIEYNYIENISILKDMEELLENSYNFAQYVYIDDIILNRGESLEIELPNIIKECFDTSSNFYVKDAQLASYNENDNISLNNDKTKLIIDTTNESLGEHDKYLYIEGDGKLSGTSINLSYKVVEDADNITPIEFGNKDLEAYLLENYDIDEDEKITAFDMAQIEDLYLGSIDIDTLKGLEYAINLKTLTFDIKYDYDDEDINYDFSQLEKLNNLKELYIEGDTYKINTLSNLANIEVLEINLSYEEDEAEEQLKQIGSLKQLKNLTLDYGELKNLEPIKTLENLQSLNITARIDYIEDWSALNNFVNLENLNIDVDQYSEEERNVLDYSFLKNLTKMKVLDIRDNSVSQIDAKNISTMTELYDLYIEKIELTNVSVLSNLVNLKYLDLCSCKIDNIEFIKNLTKLEYIYMSDNFITDISPLEELTNPYYMDFTNNPIGEIDSKYVKILEHIENERLILTEYSLLENLTFENKEFKEELLDSYDLNRDGEISKYEISEITYLSPDSVIENAQYFINLESLNISYISLTVEEQEKLIEQINLLNENTEINLYGLTFELGNILPGQTYIDIYEVAPILEEMKNPNSRIYMEGLTISEDTDYYECAEIKDGKIYFDQNFIGNAYYTVGISNENDYLYFDFTWKKVVQGDATKEIEIEDKILKEVILEDYDIDSDGKITEYDMLNLTVLDIEEKGVESLKGLENAKNLIELYAYGNKIKDISSIVEIGNTNNTWYNLGNNQITDITCLANSKAEEALNLGLMENYIDFSEGSENLAVLEADYRKTYDDVDPMINYMICKQRHGKPEDDAKVVEMDSKIKQKLIEYGIDENNDGILTRGELYNAEYNTTYYGIDLSRIRFN